MSVGRRRRGKWEPRFVAKNAARVYHIEAVVKHGGFKRVRKPEPVQREQAGTMTLIFFGVVPSTYTSVELTSTKKAMPTKSNLNQFHDELGPLTACVAKSTESGMLVYTRAERNPGAGARQPHQSIKVRTRERRRRRHMSTTWLNINKHRLKKDIAFASLYENVTKAKQILVSQHE